MTGLDKFTAFEFSICESLVRHSSDFFEKYALNIV